MMERYPVYATVRIYLGAIEAKSKEEAEDIADQPNFPWPITDWEELISIEAGEP